MFMPPVSRYMTRKPYTLELADRLSTCSDVMSQPNARHLVVLDDREAMASARELDVGAVRSANEKVLAPVTRGVAVVHKETPIDEVVELMEHGQFGAAVVVGPAGIEGMLTLVDAVRAFCGVLRGAAEAKR